MSRLYKVAVLMACHNRREKTLSCLRALLRSSEAAVVSVDIFLADASSSDGTVEAVNKSFPEVNVMSGDVDMFWNQGMRMAWNAAISNGAYDSFLLLNDDTNLFPDALTRIIDFSTEIGPRNVIVGSTCDPVDLSFTYGGVRLRKNYIGFRFDRVPPSEIALTCDSFNGNCVLIPADVMHEVGILDDVFEHGFGDYDYGLRALAVGIQTWILPGFVGECPRNKGVVAAFDESLAFNKRKESLRGSLCGTHKERAIFVRRHGGIFRSWLIGLQVQLRMYFPKLWSYLRRMRGREAI